MNIVRILACKSKRLKFEKYRSKKKIIDYTNN